MTRRITVAEVQEAYRRTGLKPIRNCWGDDGCACGLSVCAIANGLNKNHLCGDAIMNSLGLEDSYLAGFVTGFDGKPQVFANELGYQDGSAAATAIFGERPHA